MVNKAGDTISVVYFERRIWVKNSKNNVWIDMADTYGSGGIIASILGVWADMSAENAEAYIVKVKANNPNYQMNPNVLMVFTNGYIDQDLTFHKGDVPFSNGQIKMDYTPKVKLTKEMERYMDWFSSGNVNRKKSLLSMAGALLTNRNEGLLSILYSPMGGTGKTQFTSLIKEMSPGSIKLISTETTLLHGGKFALTGSKGKTGLIGDELPTALNKGATDKIKSLVDPGRKYREVEDKNENSGETHNSINMMITTNRLSSWYEVDHALKSRVNVLYIEPNLDEPFLESDFYKLREDKSSIQSLLSNVVDCYIEARNTDGWRASKYHFGVSDSKKYWDGVSESNDIVRDFIGHDADGETLEDLVLKTGVEFIPNLKFKGMFQDWQKTAGNRISLQAMKKEFKKWVEGRGFDCDIKAAKNNSRGILIAKKGDL